ncbi:hypothetical protein MBLNU230_g6118t1 [Neophaeotheca triangularis]
MSSTRANSVDGGRVNGEMKHTNGGGGGGGGGVHRSDSTSSSSNEDDSTPTSTSTSTSIPHRPAHDRKLSNPLAPPFIVSAPGKVIVYGEHAVVHGKAAMAAAISLRSYLLCTTLSKSQRTVTLNFSDIGLSHTWSIPSLPWDCFTHPSRRKKYYDLVTSLDPDLVSALQPHITPISTHLPPEKRKIHQAAASTFLYLFCSLGSPSSPACIYTLRSTIPIGAGLGSSASISVCIASALLLQARALSGPHPDQPSPEAASQLERINRWAFVGEMLIHGNPSGVDNTVATNGRAVLFQRTDYTLPPLVQILRAFPELPLLLVDTCQPKSTAAEVAKVAALKKAHPVVTESLLNAIDSVTKSAHSLITDDSFDPTSAEAVKALGELAAVNHGLLTALGVSHPRLERLKYLVEDSGIGWTKLTGAGGGGCAITFLKPDNTPSPTPNTPTSKDSDSENATTKAPSGLASLQSQLEQEGFEIFTTTLGGDGVGVLYPAVVGGVEIDQEVFLQAKGREGVEELVGGGGDPGAWRFWRPS